MRPLAYGEVGVTFLSHGSLRQILPESDLRLVDRTLQPGDYCKRSVDDVRSGVVTSATVKGRLAHAISAVPVEGWRALNDLEHKVDADIGEYVTYDDWVGQVCPINGYDELSKMIF
jgi:ubiquitin-conjugating enzyme E2 O